MKRLFKGRKARDRSAEPHFTYTAETSQAGPVSPPGPSFTPLSEDHIPRDSESATVVPYEQSTIPSDASTLMERSRAARGHPDYSIAIYGGLFRSGVYVYRDFSSSALHIDHPYLHVVCHHGFKRRSPYMTIYRYPLVQRGESRQPGIPEKRVFCTVYQHVLGNDTIRYTLEFLRGQNSELERLLASPLSAASTTVSASTISLVMINDGTSFSTDTVVNGLRLVWYGTTGVSSTFGSGYFQLIVDNEHRTKTEIYHDYVKSGSDDEFEDYLRAQEVRNRVLSPESSILATYSNRTNNAIIPISIADLNKRRRTKQLGQFSFWGYNDGHNTTKMVDTNRPPALTELILCMGLILREQETRKVIGSHLDPDSAPGGDSGDGS